MPNTSQATASSKIGAPSVTATATTCRSRPMAEIYRTVAFLPLVNDLRRARLEGWLPRLRIRSTHLRPAVSRRPWRGAVRRRRSRHRRHRAARARRPRAGPASLLAWLGLVLASIPLAATSPRSARATPTRAACRRTRGRRSAPAPRRWSAGASTLAVPVGAPAAALFAGAYVEAAFGGGTRTVFATAAGLVRRGRRDNYFGACACPAGCSWDWPRCWSSCWSAAAASLPHARLDQPAPVRAARLARHRLGRGAAGVELRRLGGGHPPGRRLPASRSGPAARHGRRHRDRRRLYLAIAAASILVLGPSAAGSDAPLAELLARGIGGPARSVAAVAAVLLTLGVMNAYYAGAAKLGAALGRDGALPAWLARGSRPARCRGAASRSPSRAAGPA